MRGKEGWSNMNTTVQKPYAALDLTSRQGKARKIDAILSKMLELKEKQVLEVGAGSGIIANHMSQCVGPGGQVVAVDVMDQCQVRNGFHFVQVTDTRLPFEDASFDVGISNHVMEHVGNRQAQLHHLREFSRVLRDEGWGYFAVPNRWRLIEPHFKLPLLSWFPLGLRSAYVRMAGLGEVYDVCPPSHYELISLFREAKLSYAQQSFEAMRIMADVESVSLPARLVLNAPKFFLLLLYPIITTMVFLLRRKQKAVDANSV